ASTSSWGPYRWQLNDGSGWMDVANDHIIEAQYSRPNTKGMTLYNTTYGAISIDFDKMKVRKTDSLRIRRRNSDKVTWMWYYRGDREWQWFYSSQDSKGKRSPVKSAHIEKEFQKSRTGIFSFSIDATNYTIAFKGTRKRDHQTLARERYFPESLVTSFRKQAHLPGCDVIQNAVRSHLPQAVLSSHQEAAHCIVSRARSLSSSPLLFWPQLLCHGLFSTADHRCCAFFQQQGTNTECSVCSSDMEAKYQQNPTGSMDFSVSSFRYRLNFSGEVLQFIYFIILFLNRQQNSTWVTVARA
uniref:Si:ch211-244b2.4 n=1 Tax=Scleropages formosus TaxID=113540 RepID=A0A8C9UAJ9_SCLFO